MLVKFKTILQGEAAGGEGENPNDIRELKLLALEFCCSEMEKACGEEMIGFSDWREHPQTDPHLNIYDQAYHTEVAHLNFCPFCGKEIKVENIETVKIRLRHRREKVLKTWTEYLEVPVNKTEEKDKEK